MNADQHLVRFGNGIGSRITRNTSGPPGASKPMARIFGDHCECHSAILTAAAIGSTLIVMDMDDFVPKRTDDALSALAKAGSRSSRLTNFMRASPCSKRKFYEPAIKSSIALTIKQAQRPLFKMTGCFALPRPQITGRKGASFDQALEQPFECADIVVNGVPLGRRENRYAILCPALETTLHNALGHAAERHHEYATLEHLLLALIDDEHAAR